jgi:hypothetical protein
VKFIPSSLSRAIASKQLLANEHAPKALFVGGVVGMVGSTVLACRATLQVSDVLERIEAEKRQHADIKSVVDDPVYTGSETYSDEEYASDLKKISIRGVLQVAKLYLPSVVLGGVSIAALTKSHNLLKDRNLALTAAYAALDRAFDNYRGRVIEKYGEDADRELRYDSEKGEFIDPETGKVTEGDIYTDAPGSAYARWYDELSAKNWSPDPDINLVVLRNVQNYMNDRLKARGHVFLNEVFSELGLSHTKAGAIVGWRYNKGSGDDYIDFGLYEGANDGVLELFNGREGAILLDFNVDGVIYDKLETGA